MQAAAEIGSNPFAVLSFIVAPAILTNASSVLAMSTSNRLARAVDRARDLALLLDSDVDSSGSAGDRLRELGTSENRALMLIQALRSFYAALGGFASAALISLLGAVMANVGPAWAVIGLEWVAVVAGLGAVAALIHGSGLLVRETRLAVGVIRERAEGIRERLQQREHSP